MVAVIGQLILHEKKDQDAAGHPDGQPADIDQGKGFVPQNIPHRDLKVVFKHSRLPQIQKRNLGKKVPSFFPKKDVLNFLRGWRRPFDHQNKKVRVNLSIYYSYKIVIFPTYL
jgi:hypothetical protein